MSIYLPRDGAAPSLFDEIERLRALAADLEAVAAGDGLPPPAVRDAPLLEGWSVAARAAPCLTGTFHGHPRIGDNCHGITSELWVLAPTFGYARTLSRFYRLGEPRRGDA